MKTQKKNVAKIFDVVAKHVSNTSKISRRIYDVVFSITSSPHLVPFCQTLSHICLGLGLVCFGIIFGLICYCKCYPKFRNYLKVRRECKVGSHDVTKEVEMQTRTPAVPKETPKETTIARRGSRESKLRIPLLDLAATTV